MVSSCTIVFLVCLTNLFFTGCQSLQEDKEFNSSLVELEQNGQQWIEECKPRNVHISFGDKIVNIKVMWSTIKQCGNCLVVYGQQPWSVHTKVSSKYTHFVKENEKGLQHLYMSELLNLSPNKTHYYTPVCEGQRSGPFYFHVPPLGGDGPAEYLVFGDMGIQTHSLHSIIKEAQSGQYMALFHVGDMAYSLHDDGGTVGDAFMKMIEPAASFLPYMTSPGNHEINEGHFSHYRHLFAMPGSDWPIPQDKLWYSLDIGLVHFVSYSSEVFFTTGGVYEYDQRKWLLNDLATANQNRNATPWVITLGHRPLYCSTRIGDDCSQPDSKVRIGLEKIFYDMKVDIVLQAHEHNYERMWPMFQGKITDHSYINVSAPIQIITGAAGSLFGTDHFVRGDKPAWSAFRVGEPALNSYGRLLVQNRTHIWWEQRIASNHTPKDGIWIIKDDMFNRVNNIPYVPYSYFSTHHVLVAGIALGTCLAVIMIFIIYQSLIKKFRRHAFEKAWHSPLLKDADIDDEDDEEEEFSQSQYHYPL